MPFLKKITGSGHSHSRSGSASSIKTWSLESPSSSDKQGSRSGKSSKKPISFDYRGSVASSGSYGSPNGFTQRLPAVPNLDVGSHGSELLSSSQLCGKHVTESTDGGSDSRKSSGGSVNSLSVDRLILSWDTTDPDEWTMQRVLSWLKFHEFPESWIDFFRKQQLSGHNFIKLLAYENFAVYEKFLRQPSTACYSRFQYLLKETMTQNVTNNHIRRRSLEKSKGSRSSSESLKSRQKKNRKHEELSSSRSTSESALLSAKSPSFNEDDKISTVPLRSHQKTTSAGALYRRSLISLRGSSSGNLLEGKQPTNIKLSIPSQPHSIVDSNEVSAKSGSPPSSPYYPGIFRRHQKSSSSESSLLNTLFGSTSNNNLDDEVEKLNHQKLDVATEGSSKSKTNFHETNSSVNARQTSGILEEKSSLWGKLRRRSQLVGLTNIPQTPHSQVSQLKVSNSANTEVELPSDASIGTLTPSDCDPKTAQRASHDVSNHGVSEQTPKSNDKSKHYSPKLFLLDKKFYPLKSKDAQDDKYILITKDNRSFIPLNIGMIQTLDELKESITLMLGINHSEISLHLTDFGCEIGSALPDDVLDTLRSSLFLNTAGKLFIKDQAGGKTRTRAATVGNETNQNLRSSQSRTSFRSVTNNMINSNDEVSIVSSSSDITSFDDLASGPIRRYPQTPNHYCETVSSNNGEELSYWNCKDTLPETGKSPRPLRSSSLAQKDKIIAPELPMEKGRIGTFQILRKDDGNEIDFNKRRESPYIQPKLAPRREAPKPPTNSSPQRSSSTSSQLQIPRLRRSSTNRQVASNSKLSVKTNISPSNDAVSPSADSVVNSYTPGSSHVLVPQPYKGVSEGSRKSKSEQDQVLNPVSTFISRQRSNRSNSIASNTSSVMNVRSPPLKKGNSKRIISSASAADVFEENDVTFSDAPEFSDPEDDSSQSSDEIIWSDRVAKPEQKNEQEIQSVSSTGTSETESNVPSVTSGDTNEQNGLDRKMTLRPSPEVVYQNLEKFFPHANLDKPVLEGVTPPVSPKSADSMGMSKAFEPEVKTDDTSVSSSPSRRPLEIPYKAEKTVRKDRLPKRAKTIRTIAHEASEARKQSMKLRRQNTKLWGTRTVEVTDKRMVSINKSKNSRGQYKEFAWIKGEMIGKGSFGAVYLCLNVTTGEMMAVKQVEVPRFGSQNEAMLHTVEALRAEVSTLKNLDHLNIVQYLGFEVKDNINSLFLEYVAGGSVGSLIRMYGRFDELMIKHLTTQVLSGLAYLHSRGILHRDMKADNLLLDQEGVCKISDFGISRKSQDIYSNSEMTMRGTVFWMAPEMVDTAQGYSAKVDIWSVGCVVLEMLAGKRPWSNLEVVAAMFKIGKSKSAPPIPEDTLPLISQSGRDFLDACFEVDPEARPTADELLRHPFLHLGHAFDFKSTKLAKLIRSNDRVNSTRLRVSSQDKSQATGSDRSLDVPINT